MQGQFARGTLTFEKRSWAKPECISGIRTRDLKEQLRLGMKRTSGWIFMRTVRQAVVLKITKRAIESSVRLQKMIGHCGGLGLTQTKEGAADSVRAGGSWKVCLTEEKKRVKWYTWTTWNIIRMSGLEEGAP
jgi:hypothetical protein